MNATRIAELKSQMMLTMHLIRGCKEPSARRFLFYQLSREGLECLKLMGKR